MEPMTWAQASLWIAGATVCVAVSLSLCFIAITKSYNAVIKTQQTELNYLQGQVNLLRAEMVNERRACDDRIQRMGARIGELEKINKIHERGP